jgi:hypothetical protein
MDAWEMECCGTPFAVGAQVEWELEALPEDSRERFVEGLSSDVAKKLTDVERHHGPWSAGDQPPPVRVRGRVKSISSAYRRSTKPRELEAAWLEDREEAVRFENEPNGARFLGYVIELSSVDMLSHSDELAAKLKGEQSNTVE